MFLQLKKIEKICEKNVRNPRKNISENQKIPTENSSQDLLVKLTNGVNNYWCLKKYYTPHKP